MATVKSLEDMLSSEVDESAVTALVGSLESQLASSNIHLPSQDINTASVTVNHVNNATVVDGSVMRLLDGQKHGLNAVSQPVSLANIGKSPASTPQIIDAVSTASNVMVTLPGALPASGYITQVTGPSQQSFFAPIGGNIAVSRALTVNNQDIKIVYSTQSPVTAVNNTTVHTRNSLKTTVPNGSPTAVNMITIRPGQPLVTVSTVNPIIPGSTTSMSAIHDLANIASQQSPIVIPNTCSASGSTVQVTPTTSHQPLPNKGNSGSAKSTVTTRMQLRERVDKNVDKSVGKIATRSQDSSSTPSSGVQNTMSSNVVQVTNPTTGSKSLPTTSHQVNVVSQVVSNPSLLPPGVQIVNVNPSRLGTPVMTGGKALAPRVVLKNPVHIAAAPQILSRPGVSGQRCMQQTNTVKVESPYRQMHVTRAPLSSKLIPFPANKNTITLQSGGMVRGAILLKTENGQIQVVNMAGAAGSPIPAGATYRLQSIQPGAQGVRTMSPQQMTVTMPVAGSGMKGGQQASVNASQTIVGTIVQQGSPALNARLQNPNMTSHGHQAVAVKVAGVNGNLSSPLAIQTATSNNQTPSAPSQMSPNTAKKKCKNFLSTLIRLADEQPPSVAKSVRNLIQGIIDGTIQAEEFTAKLQKELNSAPQPYLVPFLKKNLPFLRHSLITKELTIEGVRPPPPGALSLPHPPIGGSLQQIQVGQKRPGSQPTTQVRLMSGGTSGSLTTQLLQPTQNVLAQRFISPRLPSPLINQNKSLLVSAHNKPSFIGSSAAASSPATVGALQAKSPALGRSLPIIAAKDKGKSNFSALRDDDDINDVAAMGGVNLIEESQKILASNSEIVGTQIRSCKDESFFFTGALQRRINAIAGKQGLEEVSPEVIALVAHAAQERLKTILEKLGTVAEHRVENPKIDPRYEITHDVKSQIKFLEELDRLEKRRHEEQEREILLRAAKSRSKLEDPEQLKLKQKAKEMQRAELELARQREANTTALLAIGPRKRMKLDSSFFGSNQMGIGGLSGHNNTPTKAQPRPRVKRVNLRDLLYLMEQERETVRTPLLYKSYMK